MYGRLCNINEIADRPEKKHRWATPHLENSFQDANEGGFQLSAVILYLGNTPPTPVCTIAAAKKGDANYRAPALAGFY